MPHACSDWGGLGDSDSINVEGKAPEGQQAEENITRKGRGTYLLRFIVIFLVSNSSHPGNRDRQRASATVSSVKRRGTQILWWVCMVVLLSKYLSGGAIQ